MKKNFLLNIATILGNVFAVVVAMVFSVFTIVFIHWHIAPEVYKEVKVDVQSQKITFSQSVREVVKTRKGGDEKTVSQTTVQTGPRSEQAGEKQQYIPLAKVHRSTLYYLYAQTVGILLLLYFIAKEILKVIKSVQELTTFRSNNVHSFRRIGFMCLGLSMLQWLTLFFADGYSTVKFSIEMTPLLYMLGAFIMAEIFKEGNKLFEQDQLTI